MWIKCNANINCNKTITIFEIILKLEVLFFFSQQWPITSPKVCRQRLVGETGPYQSLSHLIICSPQFVTLITVQERKMNKYGRPIGEPYLMAL